VNKYTRHNKTDLNKMCRQRAVGRADKVVGYPQRRVGKRPQTVFCAVFLTDAADKGKRRHHRNEVEHRLEHEQVYRDKRGGVHADKPFWNGLFVFVVKVVYNRRCRTHKAGRRTVEAARTHIAECHKHICREHKQQYKLHIFALEYGRNTYTYSTESTEYKCQNIHKKIPLKRTDPRVCPISLINSQLFPSTRREQRVPR